MKSSVLTAILFSSTAALAGPHDELATARQRVHSASTSVEYHEKQTIIAERDIATARIHRDTATKQRAKALRDRDNAAASDWARRHDEAVKAEREAQDRSARSRQELDRANRELEVSTTRVRKLERSASR